MGAKQTTVANTKTNGTENDTAIVVSDSAILVADSENSDSGTHVPPEGTESHINLTTDDTKDNEVTEDAETNVDCEVVSETAIIVKTAPDPDAPLTVSDLDNLLDDLETGDNWQEHPLWCGWATNLEKTNLFYLLPGEFDFLTKLTGLQPSYLAVTNGSVTLRFVGNDDRMVDGQMWDPKLQAGLPLLLQAQLESEHILLADWARFMQRELHLRKDAWDKARHSWQEHSKVHRRMCQMLGLFCSDLNLAKTTLVQYALSYISSWHITKMPHDSQVKERGMKFIRQQLQEEVKRGLSSELFICFLLTMHISEVKDDEYNGWNIEEVVPQNIKKAFINLHQQHGDKDLYEALDMKDVPLPVFKLVPPPEFSEVE